MVREAGLIRHRFGKNLYSHSGYRPIVKKYRFHTSKKPDPSGREAETTKYLCGFDKNVLVWTGPKTEGQIQLFTV